VVELHQLQVQKDAMVKGMEKENIREMQGLRFWCCEDNQAVSPCSRCTTGFIEHCHAPLAQVQASVTSELEKFQDCLARCTFFCKEKAKDPIDAGNKALQVKQQ
jgi:hypothetical protein